MGCIPRWPRLRLAVQCQRARDEQGEDATRQAACGTAAARWGNAQAVTPLGLRDELGAMNLKQSSP